MQQLDSHTIEFTWILPFSAFKIILSYTAITMISFRTFNHNLRGGTSLTITRKPSQRWAARNPSLHLFSALHSGDVICYIMGKVFGEARCLLLSFSTVFSKEDTYTKWSQQVASVYLCTCIYVTILIKEKEAMNSREREYARGCEGEREGCKQCNYALNFK